MLPNIISPFPLPFLFPFFFLSTKQPWIKKQNMLYSLYFQLTAYFNMIRWSLLLQKLCSSKCNCTSFTISHVRVFSPDSQLFYTAYHFLLFQSILDSPTAIQKYPIPKSSLYQTPFIYQFCFVSSEFHFIIREKKFVALYLPSLMGGLSGLKSCSRNADHAVQQLGKSFSGYFIGTLEKYMVSRVRPLHS